MIQKSIFQTLCVLVITSVGCISCSNDENMDYNFPDDDGINMVWEINGEEFYSFSVLVEVEPTEISTYQCLCTSRGFSHFKITKFWVNPDYNFGYAIDLTEHDPYTPLTVEGDWFSLNIDGMEMDITFIPNETDHENTLELSIESVDGISPYPAGEYPYFDEHGFLYVQLFTFIQPAQGDIESETNIESELD